MPSLAPPPAQQSIQTFALERPALRLRRRSSQLNGNHHGDTRSVNHAALLPYFIAGDENRMAAFVCQNDSAMTLGQPILLIGSSGNGKTALALHLAARAAVALGVADKMDSVKFLTANDFARTYSLAVSADDLPQLRHEIDNAEVLVIDDLPLLAGKKAAQEELAIRLDERISRQKPTFLTCRRMPTETKGLRPRLASRSLMGLTLPINPPTGSARLLLLRELAQMRSVELSDDKLQLLDAGLPSDASVRNLDAAIKQIDLHCRMNGSAVDAKVISNAIEAQRDGDEVDINRIVRVVARLLGQKSKDLRSSSRKQSVVRARSLAMLLARRMTSKSLDQIGKFFGGRDHSTVLHAIRKTESLLATDGELARALDDASEKLVTG